MNGKQVWEKEEWIDAGVCDGRWLGRRLPQGHPRGHRAGEEDNRCKEEGCLPKTQGDLRWSPGVQLNTDATDQ